MKNEGHGRFDSLILSAAEGTIETSALPLKDQELWLQVFAHSAQTGRPRYQTIAAAAERLLHSPVDAAASEARHRAGIAALAGGDLETRRGAVRFLQEEDSPDTLPAAAAAVHDPDPEVGAGALRMLIQHKPPGTLDILLEALAHGTDLRESMAAEALYGFGAEAIPGLTAMLDHEDAQLRWRAARCLTAMATQHEEGTLTPLIKAFHDDSPDVAWVAADGLSALGPGASVPVLRSVLRQPLTEATTRALHEYAKHGTPATVFGPVAKATTSLAMATTTLTAVDKALATLESAR